MLNVQTAIYPIVAAASTWLMACNKTNSECIQLHTLDHANNSGSKKGWLGLFKKN